jgi:hypothetical protein
MDSALAQKAIAFYEKQLEVWREKARARREARRIALGEPVRPRGRPPLPADEREARRKESRRTYYAKRTKGDLTKADLSTE